MQVIKDAILQSHQRVLGGVNHEQLALYYGIGWYILANTQTKNWGKGFIEEIREQLRKVLLGLSGIPTTNLGIWEHSIGVENDEIKSDAMIFAQNEINAEQ